MKYSRRMFLATAGCGAVVGWAKGEEKQAGSLKGEVGLTTGSFSKHLSVEPKAGKLCMLDLPKIMRDDLGMRVLDAMTATLASMKPDYLEKFRSAAEKAGCVITNLKMNLKGLELASADQAKRQHALAEFKRTIDVAQQLGCRWTRPLPENQRPDIDRLAASYRELIDYAAPKGISLLVENFGWMQNDPQAIPALMKAVGSGLAACPDTGNWTDSARYTGLAQAFPLAVTCDFKAFQLEPDGQHKPYDLRRCFQIGWDAGFRGPWCLEHFDEKLPNLLANMVKLRDDLKGWMK